MSAERRSRVIEVMREIQSDMKSDTARREGQPFDGRHVAAALGEISATVSALAHAMELLLVGELEDAITGPAAAALAVADQAAADTLGLLDRGEEVRGG